MKSIQLVLLFVALSSSPFTGAQSSRDEVPPSTEYTLYRAGIDLAIGRQDETLRIHIATFDAVPHKDAIDNAAYNLQNCDIAQALFNDNQPHFRGSIISNIKIRYWCEKGRFRK